MSLRGEGEAPRDDIGWGLVTRFQEHSTICKFCDTRVIGGITRPKQHLAYQSRQIAPCQKLLAVIKKKMAPYLKDSKTKKIDKKKRREELEERLKPGDDEYENSSSLAKTLIGRRYMLKGSAQEFRQSGRRDRNTNHYPEHIMESGMAMVVVAVGAKPLGLTVFVSVTGAEPKWTNLYIPEVKMASIDPVLLRTKSAK